MRVLNCWLYYSLCVLSLFLILCVAKPCVLIRCVLIKKNVYTKLEIYRTLTTDVERRGRGGGQKSAYYVHEKVIHVKLKSLFLPRR